MAEDLEGVELSEEEEIECFLALSISSFNFISFFFVIF